MKPQLLGHYKLDDLARALAIPVPHAIGTLELLWLMAARQDGEDAIEGVLRGATPDKIARFVRWEGDAAALVDALVRVGFLDRDSDGALRVHDWQDHRPAYLNDRARKIKRENKRPEIPGTSGNIPEPPGTSGKIQPSASPPSALPEENPPVTAGAVTSPQPGTPTREQVDAIYAAYPRRRQRESARKAIARAVTALARERGTTVDQAAAWVLARTRAYAESPWARSHVEQGAREFLPYPASWFNGGGHLDDDAEWETERNAAAPRQRDGPKGAPGGDEEPAWKRDRREQAEKVRRVAGLDTPTGATG